MTEVDQAQLLRDLPPHQRDEMLRRVSVIRRFVADKSKEGAEACAAELGLGIVHFKKLVRVWELHGRADRLPGAEWPKTKSRSTTDEQLAILEDASENAPTSTVEAVVREAARLGSARGVEMPSRGTMRDRILEIRHQAAPDRVFGHDAHLVVLHAALDIPIDADGVTTMPVATLAVHPCTRRVLGLRLSSQGPDPRAAAEALHDALGRLPPSALADTASGQIRIATDTLPGEGWAALGDALKTGGAEVLGDHRSNPRRDLATAYLGRRVGGIEVRPRYATRPTEERRPYMESGQTPLTIDEALDFASRRMVPVVRPAATGPAINRLQNCLSVWLRSNA